MKSMSKKSRAHFLRSLTHALLVLLAVAITPLRAADTMAQDTESADVSHLHYLKAGKPNATNGLDPAPDAPVHA